MSTRRSTEAKAPEREATHRQARDIRVMVADAHAIDRGGLVGLIDRERGFTVVGEAASVEEVLQQCRTLSPDVLVVSMALPEQHEGALIPQLLKRAHVPDTAGRTASTAAAGGGISQGNGRVISCLLKLRNVFPRDERVQGHFPSFPANRQLESLSQK